MKTKAAWEQFDWAKQGLSAPPIQESLTAEERERFQYLLWKDAA